MPIVAPQSPGDCFDAALEAARIALTYRTPVFLLSDGYLANGSEPWQVPVGRRAARPVGRVRDRAERRGSRSGEYLPYLRDPETLARPWAVPGTPGLEHRIGGIEKADRTGNISYDPDNHDFMVADAAGQGRRHRPLAAADGGRRPRRRRPRARPRLGLDVRPDRRGLPAGPRGRRLGRPGAPAPPQPVPERSRRRSCARYDKVVIPEMNLGQLATAHPREVPGRRHQRHPGPRPAVQGRRTGGDAARSD